MSADGSLPPNTEVSLIEEALDTLLTAAIDAPPRKPEPQPIEPIRMADIETIMGRTEAERKTLDLIANPVGIACRIGIRWLGQRLFEIGGLDLMHRVIDDVAARDLRNAGRRLSIMDHRWDGIGRVDGHAGWCS